MSSSPKNAERLNSTKWNDPKQGKKLWFSQEWRNTCLWNLFRGNFHMINYQMILNILLMRRKNCYTNNRTRKTKFHWPIKLLLTMLWQTPQNPKPIFDWLYDDHKLHWNSELVKVFQSVRQSRTKNPSVTPSKTHFSLSVVVDNSLLGMDWPQLFSKWIWTLDALSHNSWSFTTVGYK